MRKEQRNVIGIYKFNRINILLLISILSSVAVVGQSPTGQEPASSDPSIARLSDSFAAAAKIVEPAVVSIDAKARVRETASRDSAPPTDSDDILEFFRRQLPPRPVAAVGSGFIVDSSGYILTNAHVVENAAKINVTLDSGDEFVAELVGLDVETDIAVLKIDAGRALPVVKFGDSESVRVGEWVLAVGSPFGLNRTVTAGIISQVERETPRGSPFQRFIQTDAAINRGNSGGPLVNLKGEVVGVNSQIATSTGDYNGIGFALPSSEAFNVYRQIRSNGKVRRGYLGVLLDSVRAEYAKVYGLEDERGAIVTEVRDGDGPAGAAGLAAGDVIVEFDGHKIASAQDLIARVGGALPERPISLVFLREEGSTLVRRSVNLRLGERPPRPGQGRNDADPPRRLPLETNAGDKPFGLTVTTIAPELAEALKLEGQAGLVVKEINPESYIADVKLSTGADALDKGDIIQRLNRVPVTDPNSFADMANRLKKGDPVVLHVLTPVPGSQLTQLKIVQFTVR
jgi:serine protease Do